jgi:hypothetical protein
VWPLLCLCATHGHSGYLFVYVALSELQAFLSCSWKSGPVFGDGRLGISNLRVMFGEPSSRWT